MPISAKTITWALIFFMSFWGAMMFPPVADAAKRPNGSKLVGNDISWPQCGKTLPTGQAFGIVGINGGTAANLNPCLAAQLEWAQSSTGTAPNQDPVQLYVNTANPGEVIDQINTWPTSNTAATTNPYGTCEGANDKACSWQYGWDRAAYAVNYFAAQAANAGLDGSTAKYKWWLDVETMNTWQSGSPEAYERNVAALEGWVDYYKHAGARVGLYSTGYQWGQITVGAVSTVSNLNGLDNWLAGARSLKGAQSNCKLTPLTTGSKVTLTQYVSGSLDYNYACPQ